MAADGDSALAAALSGEFDLLLLDLVLPCRHGLAVLEELRRAGVGLPVIILTASHGLDDTLAGLQGGAADYVTKPFRFEELLARVRLRLRDQRPPEPTVLRHGQLELDLRTRLARVGERSVALSAREFLLAETLVRNAGQVLSRQQLLSRVWGYGHDPGSNVVDVHVCALRRKLGPELIATVRGVGYRLGTP